MAARNKKEETPQDGGILNASTAVGEARSLPEIREKEYEEKFGIDVPDLQVRADRSRMEHNNSAAPLSEVSTIPTPNEVKSEAEDEKLQGLSEKEIRAMRRAGKRNSRDVKRFEREMDREAAWEARRKAWAERKAAREAEREEERRIREEKRENARFARKSRNIDGITSRAEAGSKSGLKYTPEQLKRMNEQGHAAWAAREDEGAARQGEMDMLMEDIDRKSHQADVDLYWKEQRDEKEEKKYAKAAENMERIMSDVDAISDNEDRPLRMKMQKDEDDLAASEAEEEKKMNDEIDADIATEAKATADRLHAQYAADEDEKAYRQGAMDAVMEGVNRKADEIDRNLFFANDKERKFWKDADRAADATRAMAEDLEAQRNNEEILKKYKKGNEDAAISAEIDEEGRQIDEAITANTEAEAKAVADKLHAEYAAREDDWADFEEQQERLREGVQQRADEIDSDLYYTQKREKELEEKNAKGEELAREFASDQEAKRNNEEILAKLERDKEDAEISAQIDEETRRLNEEIDEEANVNEVAESVKKELPLHDEIEPAVKEDPAVHPIVGKAEQLNPAGIIRPDFSGKPTPEETPAKEEDELTTMMKDLSDKIKSWEDARRVAKEQDAVAQKASRSMKMISGISDGLTALVNLMGTAKGGSNIDLGTGSLTPLAKRLEEARKERKADIKSIDDKLDTYAKQFDALRLAKYKQDKATEAASAEFTRQMALEDYKHKQNLELVDAKAKAAESLARTKAEDKATLEADKAAWKSYEEEMERAWKSEENELDRENDLAVAETRSKGKRSGTGTGKGSITPVSFYDADGKEISYNVPTRRLAVINKNAMLFVEKDIAAGNTALATALQEYTTTSMLAQNGVKTKEEVAAALNKVLRLSPTYRAEIKKYSTEQAAGKEAKSNTWDIYE
jgi:hypothetical protein